MTLSQGEAHNADTVLHRPIKPRQDSCDNIAAFNHGGTVKLRARVHPDAFTRHCPPGNRVRRMGTMCAGISPRRIGDRKAGIVGEQIALYRGS
jgi:hypothetical protein